MFFHSMHLNFVSLTSVLVKASIAFFNLTGQDVTHRLPCIIVQFDLNYNSILISCVCWLDQQLHENFFFIQG